MASSSQRKLSLFEIYWFIYGAILRQGSNVEIRSNGLRILFGTWWLFVVVLTSLYTGGLTAFMTKTESSLLVNTLDDLSQRSDAKWVTVKGTALESYIKVFKLYLYNFISKKKISESPSFEQ